MNKTDVREDMQTPDRQTDRQKGTKAESQAGRPAGILTKQI